LNQGVPPGVHKEPSLDLGAPLNEKQEAQPARYNFRPKHSGYLDFLRQNKFGYKVKNSYQNSRKDIDDACMKINITQALKTFRRATVTSMFKEMSQIHLKGTIQL
jgi:hypothetical protein